MNNNLYKKIINHLTEKMFISQILTQDDVFSSQIHGVTISEGKMGMYESEGEESSSSVCSVSVTDHTESPQPPPVPTTTTTNPPPPTSHSSIRGGTELAEWYVCQTPTIGPQPGPLPGPPPPHHLGHHFNQLIHPQAAAY